jgi:hypothetical protein
VWEKFKPTENPGYSWFPFDVVNWLTSPVVNAMSPTAQGIYARLLAVQWRDGYVSTDPKSLAVQTGFDTRTCVGWFETWGDRLFVCIDHPGGGCDVFESLRNSRALSETTGKSRRSSVSLRNRPEPSGTCRKCVNGKLHFLSIKQGKLSLAAGLEENSEYGKVDGDGENKELVTVANDSSIFPYIHNNGNDKTSGSPKAAVQTEAEDNPACMGNGSAPIQQAGNDPAEWLAEVFRVLVDANPHADPKMIPKDWKTLWAESFRKMLDLEQDNSRGLHPVAVVLEYICYSQTPEQQKYYRRPAVLEDKHTTVLYSGVQKLKKAKAWEPIWRRFLAQPNLQRFFEQPANAEVSNEEIEFLDEAKVESFNIEGDDELA